MLIYNLSQSEIDMCIISHGKKMKNKLSSAQVVSASTLAKRRLLSLVLPLEHQLVFKIRFASPKDENGPAQWSGLISLKTALKGSNQTSWLVKSKCWSNLTNGPYFLKYFTAFLVLSVPLKNHKEHFQSVWCQLTFETDQEFPVYLVCTNSLVNASNFSMVDHFVQCTFCVQVVFRPLCSVVSFLPSDTNFKIFNELGTELDNAISSEGRVTDLLIPDTVSLDKYSVECRNE